MLERKHWILILLVPVAVALDQITKTIALRLLSPRRIETIIPDYFNFVLVKNRGMAFGLFNDLESTWRMPLFIGISIVAILIIVHLFRQARGDAIFLPVSLSLILSGAIGNLTDRFRWGFVVDFINLHYRDHHWPTFNVADTAISIGIAILVVDTFFAPGEEQGEGAGEAGEEADARAQGFPEEGETEETG